MSKILLVVSENVFLEDHRKTNIMNIKKTIGGIV